MAEEQGMVQTLGFNFKEMNHNEWINIICRNRKMFIQTTLALMLPVSCLFLARSAIINHLCHRLLISGADLDITVLWAIPTVFFTSFLLFFLLSSSSVAFFVFAYTHSSSSSETITFRKAMAAAPRIWINLIRTLIYVLLVFGLYDLVFFEVYQITCAIFIRETASVYIVIFALYILHTLGFYPIGIVWQLASVVSILEGVHGIEALKRSKALVKGKLGSASLVSFCWFYIWFCIAGLVFDWGVIEESIRGGVGGVRIAVGGCAMLLFFGMVPFVIVNQTYFYLACKEHHSETVDMCLLSQNLEGYLGDYIALQSDGEIQLQELCV